MILGQSAFVPSHIIDESVIHFENMFISDCDAVGACI